MAVYTQVSDQQLQELLSLYNIGRASSCKGLIEGVENTNYILTTDQGQYILTLYEQRVNPDDLPFFMNLLQHLGHKDFLCPPPIMRLDGRTLSHVAGRHAAIFPFLSGLSTSSPNTFHCRAVGTALAELHLAAKDMPAPYRKNSMGCEAWHKLADATLDQADTITEGLGDLIRQSLDEIDQHWPSDLPRGICHADMFTDNVLFNGTNISGIIDFYFACEDFWLYDLAVTINAWSFSPFGTFYFSNSFALVQAYHKVRPLSMAEHDHLMLMLQASALRFLLTRLYDWVNTPADAVVKRKDPMEYVRVLRFLRQKHSPSFFGLSKEMIV